MLVLIDSLCGLSPLEYFSESGPERVIAQNKLVKFDVGLKKLVEAAEDTATEHHNTLLECGSDELFLTLRLTPTATLHIF